MAAPRMVIASFLLVCLILSSLVEAEQVETVQATVTSSQGKGRINCAAACAARCRLASRQKMCLRACGTCCARCSCVPPGTSGNRDVCPCYATMTTHGGRLKCP
ncbi:hypothetical protein MLD38_012863 [Melastoma candidum]|uniref:Uncharacterized protein n=1 Tax=Melastoma candidum TaxID=119954 RepID=A0ACB9R902_9MYRT|nr:hypothetical protein MLD38_012863 [Melastoma candidum]